MKSRSFNEAKKFVHSLSLKSTKEWKTYCKSGTKPQNIPLYPDRVYEKDWISWGRLVSTGTVTPRREYRSFDAARDYVTELGLKNQEEWRKYSKSGKKPKDLPANPTSVYRKHWKGWGDWLGTRKNRKSK